MRTTRIGGTLFVQGSIRQRCIGKTRIDTKCQWKIEESGDNRRVIRESRWRDDSRLLG